MATDNRTTHYNLPLPNKDNKLSEDEPRLEQALAGIDTALHGLASALVPMKGATANAAGAAGLTPAPAAGDAGKFLKGDGTWTAVNAAPMTGATASTAGTAGFVPAPAAGDNAKYLRGDGTWAEVSGGGASISVVSAPAIAGDSVIATGHSKTFTFSASALLSGSRIDHFDVSFGGQTFTVTATDNTGTLALEMPSGTAAGTVLTISAIAHDNLGNCGLTATKDVTAATATVDQPTVTVSSASVYPTTAITLTGSTFSTTGASGTHAKTDWAIFSSANTAGTPEWSILDDTADKTSKTVPANALAAGVYYASCRYYDAGLGWSAWATPAAVTVMQPYVNGPILSASPTPVYPNSALALTGTPFGVTGGTGTHTKTDWQICATNNSAGTAIWSSLDDSTNKTSITVTANTLSLGTYYAFARYFDGTRGVWSDWSDSLMIEVATSAILPPVIQSPAANGTVSNQLMIVTVDSISVAGGTDTQTSLTVEICSDAAGTNVLKTKTLSGTGTSVTFSSSDLASLSTHTQYYLFASRVGSTYGESPRSSVAFTIEAGIYVRGCIVYPNADGETCMIEAKKRDGSKLVLKVPWSKYRTKKQFGAYGKDNQDLANCTDYYYIHTASASGSGAPAASADVPSSIILPSEKK